MSKTKRKKKRRLTKFSKVMLIIIALLVVILIIQKVAPNFNPVAAIHFGDSKTTAEAAEKERQRQLEEERIKEEKRKLEEYNNCLADPTLEVTSDELIAKTTELNEYIQSKYKASVLYEDLTFGYKYGYNESVTYYAASTIKSLDALYIYTKASEGTIDLDSTLTYTSTYEAGASKEMAKYSFGSKVSLRNLVKYAVTVSDNSAHFMLLDYIGMNNLKAFGQSLGATKTLVGNDRFGHINVNDGIIYMKAINEFINNNSELGEELKSYFVEAEQNELKMTDLGIEAAHKYGEFSPVYHDIGIVYAEHPYVIAILTKEKNNVDFEERVQNINRQVYDLHLLYYTTRENTCQLQIYGS